MWSGWARGSVSWLCLAAQQTDRERNCRKSCWGGSGWHKTIKKTWYLKRFMGLFYSYVTARACQVLIIDGGDKINKAWRTSAHTWSIKPASTVSSWLSWNVTHFFSVPFQSTSRGEVSGKVKISGLCSWAKYRYPRTHVVSDRPTASEPPSWAELWTDICTTDSVHRWHGQRVKHPAPSSFDGKSIQLLH